MTLTVEKKKEIIKDFQEKKSDTGSSAVQIALITKRINELAEHFKLHKKDNHSRYGLIKLVSQRKKLLKYLSKVSPKKYQSTITQLGLRK